MGDGRQREASTGALVPSPRSLATTEALVEQQDWNDASTDRWPGLDATELNNDHQISPTQPMPRRHKTVTIIARQRSAVQHAWEQTVTWPE